MTSTKIILDTLRNFTLIIFLQANKFFVSKFSFFAFQPPMLIIQENMVVLKVLIVKGQNLIFMCIKLKLFRTPRKSSGTRTLSLESLLSEPNTKHSNESFDTSHDSHLFTG